VNLQGPATPVAAADVEHPRPRAPAPGSGTDRIAWFHCFAGIAGDMALGSLLDAGAPLDEVLGLLERIPLPSWSLSQETVLRGGISCTRAVVSARDDVVIRTYAHILGLLSEARLPARVTERSLAVFEALARAEARLHRRAPAQVHFHEVGGHDAIIDIVGTASALEVLEVDEVAASAVATGTGTIRAAHGLLPNPSPAVVRLLEGAPTYGRDVRSELTTPTGAAILGALAGGFGPLPPMTVWSSGFGAGSADLADLPNCTQVVIGERVGADVGDGQPVAVLETNLDDVTGEQLGHVVAELVAAGAHDAWVTPVLMKKGRPGHVLHALCDPALVGPLREVMCAGTGTLGVRAVTGTRWPAARHTDEVQVEGQTVRVKVGPGRAKPEFDDVARAARHTGMGLHEVGSRAEEAWRRDVAPPMDSSIGTGLDAPEDPEPA